MRHVAATIRANVGARFFHVATGGFDSHSAQENGFYHSYLLHDVSECVAALYNELNQSVSLPGGYSGYLTGNLASKVIIVTFSEFGRTIRQNAAAPGTAGTDHAACSPQLVVGGSVIGGQHAPYPLLDDPRPDVEDDLKMSVDVRDLPVGRRRVLADVVEVVDGADEVRVGDRAGARVHRDRSGRQRAPCRILHRVEARRVEGFDVEDRERARHERARRSRCPGFRRRCPPRPPRVE
jgi:uncharacterized protein (DUF1501 family)